MATINKTMKTLSVADGQDTIKYEIVDDAGRKCIALDWASNAARAFYEDEYVVKDGTVYRFIKDHPQGGSWSASEVVATNLGSEITNLKSALSNVNDLVNEEKLGFGDINYHDFNSAISNSTNFFSRFSKIEAKSNGRKLDKIYCKNSAATATSLRFFLAKIVNGYLTKVESFVISLISSKEEYVNGVDFTSNVEISEGVLLGYQYSGPAYLYYGGRNGSYTYGGNFDSYAPISGFDTVTYGISMYCTYKSELPSEITRLSNIKAPISILTDGDALAKGEKVDNCYYYTSETSSSSYCYYIIPVESGKTYNFASVDPSNSNFYKPRYVSKKGENLQSFDNVSGVYSYTADFTGNIYVTFKKDHDAYGYTGSNYKDGSYTNPLIAVASDEVSNNQNVIPSQYGVYEIVDKTIIDKVFADKNIFLASPLFRSKFYVPSSATAFAHMTGGTVDTFRVHVENGHTYSIAAGMRFLIYEDDSSYAYNAGSVTGTTDIYEYTATKSGFLYVTFATGKVGNSFMYDNAEVTVRTDEVGTYDNPIFNIQSVPQTIPYYTGSSASMTDSDKIEIGIMNVAKDVVYEFKARITSLSGLIIGHGASPQNYASWLEITSDKAIVHNYRYSTDSKQTETHGLTLSGFIFVSIKTTDGYKANVTIITESGSYSFTDNVWFGNNNAKYYAEVVTGTLTDARLTLLLADAMKDIYLFGDSYVTYDTNDTQYISNVDNRWPMYLKQDGKLGNLLINGFSGESSTDAITAMTTMGNTKHPKFAIWALGMNDSVDTSDTVPNSTWKTNTELFIQWCNANSITPILATIPSVPTRNNKGKSYYVRNSGYRYIDFDKAVGADLSSSWYSGMLDADGIHPSASGAFALYQQAVLDFPEILWND